MPPQVWSAPLVLLLLAQNSRGAVGGSEGQRPPSRPAPHSERPLPVVVDTDIGMDLDDAWSIGYLLSSPEVDVRLIVTSSRCTRGKAALVAKYLTEVGRTDVAIGVGIPTSPAFPTYRSWCNGTGEEENCEAGFFVGPQAPYAGDADLLAYAGRVDFDGVQAMGQFLLSEEKATLVELGPFTNLAALQERFPDAARRADLVAMAGSIRLGWLGRLPQASEYNVRTDAAAARAVFRNAAGWRSIAIAPLDTCGALQLTGDDYQSVRRSAKSGPNLVASALLDQYEVWYDDGCLHEASCCSPSVRPYSPNTASSTIFDVQPAYMVVNPSFAALVMAEMMLDVNQSGYTVQSPEGGRVMVALRWAPGGLEHFYGSVVQRLSSGSSKTSTLGASIVV